MTTLTLGFHTSLELPTEAQSFRDASIVLQPFWTVRDLGSFIEQLGASANCGIRVTALLNQKRGSVAPPHGLATDHFENGDHVTVLGDVRVGLWPATAPLPSKVAGQPVPITIFTGFLGSGKTTVLNHLLQIQREMKFAIIENEFGAVPIDNELLNQNTAFQNAEQIVVMENGCMCCTVRGDLLGAFDSIRRQMEKGSPLDGVIIETTGMADPVPIVRTLRQTPDIARYFRLDGTITLVDAKTILSRLSESTNEDQERHRQIAFADRILLNKIDIVTDQAAAQVFQRIRAYNASAKVTACVKGILPAAELTNIGAFDIKMIAAEEEEHGHGHEGGHEGHGGHDHGHECDSGDDADHGVGHGGGHVAGHGHGLGQSHDSQIGSFSIVRKGVEVEALEFQRWVRVLATLPEEQGKVYRSKGILAVAGSASKLIFHAVADVTETQEGPEWNETEERICKIVFIGKKLDRQKIEERFLKVMTPGVPSLRPPSLAADASSSFLRLAQSGLLHAALLGCWTKDVLCVSQAAAVLHDALFGPHSYQYFRIAATALLAAPRQPAGLHRVQEEVRKERDGGLWLHALLPLQSVSAYATAHSQAKVVIRTPFHPDHFDGAPLSFDDRLDVEAAGVMFKELCELKTNDGCSNFVVEFTWRQETMDSFFAVPGSATNSSLVKIIVPDPEGDEDNDDELKFRVNLNPEKNEESGMSMHRMSLQLVGGKSSSRIYQLFFHTIDPSYQVHVNVEDHRQPIFTTKEVFHQWHPLMAGLRRRPRLRFLIRAKPLESGPLDAMCGCCG